MVNILKKDLMYFIDRIVETDEFWELNYYMRSMKKAPHGGRSEEHTSELQSH